MEGWGHQPKLKMVNFLVIKKMQIKTLSDSIIPVRMDRIKYSRDSSWWQEFRDGKDPLLSLYEGETCILFGNTFDGFSDIRE